MKLKGKPETWKTKQKPKLHIRLHFKEQTQSQKKAGDLSILASGTVKPRMITDPGKTKGRGRMKGKEKKKNGKWPQLGFVAAALIPWPGHSRDYRRTDKMPESGPGAKWVSAQQWLLHPRWRR